MGWLITLAVLFLIAIAPLGVRIRYDESGAYVAIIVGAFRIGVIPSKPKQKNKNKKQKEAKPTAEKKEPAKKENKKTNGGSITDFLPLVRIVLDFLEGFRRKLRVDHLQMKLILGGGDPTDLACNYGKGWAVLGSLMPLLERVLVIKKRDLEVECDFTADKTTITAGADLTIRVWRLLALALAHGPRAIKKYLSIMKIRKGGANT